MSVMDSTAVVICLFVLLCQAEGDGKEERLSVTTGTDLLLEVGKPVILQEDESLFWKFNTTVTIVILRHTNEEELNPNYEGRAELFLQNQSLLLKKVQKTDSGEYKAVVLSNRDRVLVTYQVTVQDPKKSVPDDGRSKIYVPIIVTLVILVVACAAGGVYYRHYRQQGFTSARTTE